MSQYEKKIEAARAELAAAETALQRAQKQQAALLERFQKQIEKMEAEKATLEAQPTTDATVAGIEKIEGLLERQKSVLEQLEGDSREVREAKALVEDKQAVLSELEASELEESEKELTDSLSDGVVEQKVKKTANPFPAFIPAIILVILFVVILCTVGISNKDSSEQPTTATADVTTVTSNTPDTSSDETTEPVVSPARGTGFHVEEHNGVWGAYNENGLVDDFTGIAKNKNGYWYLKDGLVDFDYSGTVEYKGTTYTVTKGQAVPQ